MEYEDRVTVYSYVLGETYECETIKEAIEHIEVKGQSALDIVIDFADCLD